MTITCTCMHVCVHVHGIVYTRTCTLYIQCTCTCTMEVQGVCDLPLCLTQSDRLVYTRLAKAFQTSVQKFQLLQKVMYPVHVMMCIHTCTYSKRQKNVSKNVRYRFVKRYLPCGFVAVFDSRAVRF